MYKPVVPSLANGEIIKDLLDLCNEYFIDGMVQEYAGATPSCMYCGASRPWSGKPHHSVSDCPIMKYKDLANKHKPWIVEV